MASRSVVFDSNVWIALFHQNDSQHAKARKVFSVLNSQIIIPEYIILEVCTVLAQRASKKYANIFLERISDNDDVGILHFEENHFYSFCDAYRRLPDGKLSFVDCALLCLSKEYEIITFDTELKRVLNNDLSSTVGAKKK